VGFGGEAQRRPFQKLRGGREANTSSGTKCLLESASVTAARGSECGGLWGHSWEEPEMFI
jgi:hypothetical protein